MTLLDTLKQARGMTMVDEDGSSSELEFLPGLSNEQISALEDKLPCPIPTDIKDVLKYTSGFKNGPLENVSFSGTPSEILDVFPYCFPVAEDGFGNFWIIDLTSQSREWGPVFYACHDPAVIVYQADSLDTFV